MEFLKKKKIINNKRRLFFKKIFIISLLHFLQSLLNFITIIICSIRRWVNIIDLKEKNDGIKYNYI
jgi:hypothetical protein